MKNKTKTKTLELYAYFATTSTVRLYSYQKASSPLPCLKVCEQNNAHLPDLYYDAPLQALLPSCEEHRVEHWLRRMARHIERADARQAAASRAQCLDMACAAGSRSPLGVKAP